VTDPVQPPKEEEATLPRTYYQLSKTYPPSPKDEFREAKWLQRCAKSATEIGEAVGMKSHHRLITAYIKPLLVMKLIEQTIPNSPRAPNQKYRLAS